MLVKLPKKDWQRATFIVPLLLTFMDYYNGGRWKSVRDIKNRLSMPPFKESSRLSYRNINGYCDKLYKKFDILERRTVEGKYQWALKQDDRRTFEIVKHIISEMEMSSLNNRKTIDEHQLLTEIFIKSDYYKKLPRKILQASQKENLRALRIASPELNEEMKKGMIQKCAVFSRQAHHQKKLLLDVYGLDVKYNPKTHELGWKENGTMQSFPALSVTLCDAMGIIPESVKYKPPKDIKEILHPDIYKKLTEVSSEN